MAIANTDPQLELEDFEAKAAEFFDRPALASPVFVGQDRLAVLDDRSGRPQISVVDLSDGRVREVTTFPERIQTLLGSPAGVMVFGMDVGGNERQQLWRLSSHDSKPERIVSSPDRIHEPGFLSRDGAYLLYRSNARDEATFDILGMTIESHDEEIWLESAGQAMPVVLTRDRSKALVVRVVTNLDAELLLIDRDSETTSNLTSSEDECWILGAAFHPDERSVWVLNNAGSEFVHLDRIDLETSECTTVVDDTWDIESFAVSPDGSWLVWSVNENGWSKVSLRSLDRDSQAISLDLPRGTIDRFSWSADSACVAIGMSTASRPSMIYVADHEGEIQTVGLPGARAHPSAVEPELVQFPAFDGREIPAFLFRPEGQGPFPVLVEIHGGPESQRRLQYSSAVPTDQLIQSLGIAVLSLNVRGSTGYGKSYSHLDDKDLRLDSVRDVAAAVDWLRTRTDVIPDRIGVMGQSYGGFMTLASICFHPDLWAAAVDVVGIANFVTFLERTGPWRRAHRSQEYGFLETDREMLERISPLNHVDAITTPLFVIHGRNDPRVPLHEAEQIVSVLSERGQDQPTHFRQRGTWTFETVESGHRPCRGGGISREAFAPRTSLTETPRLDVVGCCLEYHRREDRVPL